MPLFIVILVIYKYNQSAEGTGGLGTIRGNKVGDSNVEFANLHCNNNDKKNIKKKKNKKKKTFMRVPRFEPRIHGFTVHQDIHYAMEANAIFR